MNLFGKILMTVGALAITIAGLIMLFAAHALLGVLGLGFVCLIVGGLILDNTDKF